MNLKRTKRQIQAVNKWVDNGRRGTLQFATGVGKTRTAIIAIKKLIRISKIEPLIHIVVPTKYLQKQWQEELIKQGLGFHLIAVSVINTYVKEHRECDLLILDEIHNYGSMKRLQVFKTRYKYLLGLTATMERRDLHHKIITSYAPIVDSINLDEARDEGYVSDYIVYNLGIELNPTDRETLKLYNKEFHKHFAYFGHDFNLAMSCMGDKIARARYSKASGFPEEQVGFHAVRFNFFMQKRKNFLYNIHSKWVVVEQILLKFKDKRTITFSENTIFADSIMGVSYHSKIKKKEREQNLLHFKNGDVSVLNTSKALDEGFDVGDIELVIITSSRAVKRVDIQRTGRAIRFKPGKLAVIVNLYVKNSKDEDWLRERQEKSVNIYWIDDVNQIQFERPHVRSSK
jgi:RNA polymerase primary sigma factor